MNNLLFLYFKGSMEPQKSLGGLSSINWTVLEQFWSFWVLTQLWPLFASTAGRRACPSAYNEKDFFFLCDGNHHTTATTFLLQKNDCNKAKLIIICSSLRAKYFLIFRRNHCILQDCGLLFCLNTNESTEKVSKTFFFKILLKVSCW